MKRLRDYIKLSLRSMSHRKKRSWLTIIGILIGMTAVVALISIGQSMQLAINKQFEQFGYNTITITAGAARGGFRDPHSSSIEIDVDTIRNIEGIESAGAMLFKHAYVKTGKIEGFLQVLGITKSMPELSTEVELAEGREFEKNEGFEAILGSQIKTELGADLGHEISIEDQPFKVIGILKERANNQMGLNDAILVPIETLGNLFNEQGSVSMIFAKAEEDKKIDKIATDIEETLKDIRGREDFSVTTTEQFRQMVGNAVGIVQAFLAGIAGISLLVGGIGVMNTMYTAVMERTKEIGIMKAVGARNGQIMLIFLIESGFMGLVGGAIGTGIGLGINVVAVMAAKKFIQGANLLEISISPGLIIGALFFSFLLGALSGLFPARNAAKLKPVEALRYE